MPGRCNRHHELQLTRRANEQRQDEWNTQMRDARYLRAEAELCLEMARQMSDQTTSDNLRAEAARYQAEAAEIETGVKSWVAKAAPEQN
jgi:hypothetical protein